MTRGDPVTTFQKQSETCESLGAILEETNSRQGFSNIVLTFSLDSIKDGMKRSFSSAGSINTSITTTAFKGDNLWLQCDS